MYTVKRTDSGRLIEKAKEYMTRQINRLFDLGYREGIITIQDEEKRMIVFFGTMMQYRFMSGMSKEEYKQFIYECMVKSLN